MTPSVGDTGPGGRARSRSSAIRATATPRAVAARWAGAGWRALAATRDAVDRCSEALARAHAPLCALACAAVLAGCASLGGAPAPEAADVGVPAQLQSRQLIVTLAPAPPSRWAEVRRLLARTYGLREVGAFPLESLGVQCVVYQVPADLPLDRALAELGADPRVESAQPNQVFEGLAASHDDPYAAMQYGPRAIHATEAHRWATGKGVRVGVVDTGVDTNHPDLHPRVVATASFVHGGVQSFGYDRHGTAVAGVIAAVADNHIGIFGVAPDAEIVAAKACWQRRSEDLAARCSSWSLAKAVDYAIAGRVRVLNLSLGGPPDALLGRLITGAADRGIVVVAAVLDASHPGFPASLDTVMAVVAIGPDGEAPLSQSAPHAGLLAAPGVDVLTTAPHGGYDFRSGSSLAAAHVSGIAALLLQRQPGLTPAAVREILVATARPVGGTGAEPRAARVDACAALARLVGEPGCP